ncbi:MAG: rhodanese-like domain-containing protein [Acidobacteria bacterium]|nr:rhodanese-like domain-containing protein [Acidobacteriota bacterium]
MISITPNSSRKALMTGNAPAGITCTRSDAEGGAEAVGINNSARRDYAYLTSEPRSDRAENEYKADNEVPHEWRDPSLADRSRPIITTCETGEMAALAGKLLKGMGFTNAHILKGGTVGWKDAGYPTHAP